MKAMYEQDELIKSIKDFDECKNFWYKWNGKTVHRAVLISLQYRTLKTAIENGRIYTAKKHEPDKLVD